MDKKQTIEKLQDLLSGHCYAPLKEAAEKWIEEVSDKAEDVYDKALESDLVAKLKDGVATVDEMIETFSSSEAVQKFGEEMSSRIKNHALELKEKGEVICDCDACKKALSILEDFGEKIDVRR